jgi:uncharacterized membrane protein YraQ (UPF0718 family)
MLQGLPNSVLQMSVIFLSIVIEALPFVLLGCLISGALQVFLTPERVTKILPKNKLASIAMGCGLGVFFPSCECGIVPIVNQFVKKDVPVHTAFAFMLTAPIVNPIVIFSTFIAFGNSAKFAVLRVLGSLLVAMVVGIWLAYFSKQEILKKQLSTASTEHHQGHHHDHAHVHTHESEAKERKWTHQMRHLLQHSIDEFFDTGRYLIIGGLIAAAMQTYLPTGMMLTLGSTKFLAVLVMLVLALTMSLCSEADAFIGSSLLSLFGAGPVVGFLVFGPMVDIKNLLMMKRYFTGRFIATMVGLIAVVVSIYAWVV